MIHRRCWPAIALLLTTLLLAACSSPASFGSAPVGRGANSSQVVPSEYASMRDVSFEMFGRNARWPVRSPVEPRKSLVFASDGGTSGSTGNLCAYASSGMAQWPLWCQSGSPLKTPGGMWVDASGNLYVADGGGFVFEYDTPSDSAPGEPSFTYDDSLGAQGTQQPQSAVVCGGYLYASNKVGGSGGNTYFSFTVWEIGDAKPLGIMTRPPYYVDSQGEGQGLGIACDTEGHVDFAYTAEYAGPGAIDEWTQANGNTLPAFVETLAAGPNWLQGLAVSHKDLLVTGDPFYTVHRSQQAAILFFEPTRAKPAHVCGKQMVPAMSDPYAEAFELKDKHLWIADAGNNILYQIVPATCEVTDTITIGSNNSPFKALDGVALSPNGIPL